MSCRVSAAHTVSKGARGFYYERPLEAADCLLLQEECSDQLQDLEESHSAGKIAWRASSICLLHLHNLHYSRGLSSLQYGPGRAKATFAQDWTGIHVWLCFILTDAALFVRRMYFDNHHLCYYNDGFEGKPCLQYQLDKSIFKKDLHHKILSALLYHCHTVCQYK